jgi:DNA-directed RNA polymerase subunit RPC12/RpoP
LDAEYVFDPEYKNLDCPQCHLRRIYHDRDIGFYCMSCGREFSYDEIVLLIEKAERTSQPKRKSGKGAKQPPVEIKELPSPKAKKSRRPARDATQPDQTDSDSQLQSD